MTPIWWKKLPLYRFCMLRGDAAVPAVWFSIEPIFGLFALKNGPETWVEFVNLLQSPIIAIINLITLAATLLYTKAWFELAPKIANIIVKGEKMGPEPIIRSLWVVAVITTIAIPSTALYW